MKDFKRFDRVRYVPHHATSEADCEVGSCCDHEPIFFLRYLLAAWRLIQWLRILVSSGLMTRSTLGKEWNELPTCNRWLTMLSDWIWGTRSLWVLPAGAKTLIWLDLAESDLAIKLKGVQS